MTITHGVEKTRAALPELLEAAHRGEVTIITKHGKPYAALVPLEMVPAPILRVQDLAGSGQGAYDADHVQRLRDEWG